MEIKDLSVSGLMTTDLTTVTPETPIQDASDTLLEQSIGSLLVVEDGELVGILTGTDFIALVSDDLSTTDKTVAECMSEAVITVDEDDSVRDAAASMISHDIQHLPVMGTDDSVVGMISATDLTAHLSYLEA